MKISSINSSTSFKGNPLDKLTKNPLTSTLVAAAFLEHHLKNESTEDCFEKTTNDSLEQEIEQEENKNVEEPETYVEEDDDNDILDSLLFWWLFR